MEARDAKISSRQIVVGVSCILVMPDDHPAISSLQSRLGGKCTS